MSKLTDEETAEFKRLWHKSMSGQPLLPMPPPIQITPLPMYGIWDSGHGGWMLRSGNDPQIFMDVRKGVCIAQLKAWDLRNAEVREIGPDGLPVEEVSRTITDTERLDHFDKPFAEGDEIRQTFSQDEWTFRDKRYFSVREALDAAIAVTAVQP